MRPAAIPVPETQLQVAPSLFKRLGLSLLEPAPNFPEFFRQAWTILEPHKTLVESWYIDYIAEHLQAVDLGQIQNLRISIPPRYLKSSLVTVTWPAWSWIDRPWLRWVFASYSAELAEKHSMDRRMIIQSDFYRAKWGDHVMLAGDQNRQAEFQNLERGAMVAVGIGGSVTGKGGDRVVADDPLNPLMAESNAERERSVRFWSQTLSTRLDDKKRGVKVIVAQRLHAQDVVGSILKEEGWVHVEVPAIAEKKTLVTFPISRRELTREKGEVICAEREDEAVLLKQKIIMGTRGFEAQYQQRPTSESGNILKRAWWKYYTTPPQFINLTAWSWDTAMEEGEENAYSVGILLKHAANGTFIDRIIRERVEYPDLKRLIVEQFRLYPANILLIEDKVSGKSLAQDLKKADALNGLTLPVVPYKPSGDKVFRANLCAPYVEAGRVSINATDPKVDDFVNECAEFPNAQNADCVDAFSQGMNHYYLGAGVPVAAMSGQTGQRPRPDWMRP